MRQDPILLSNQYLIFWQGDKQNNIKHKKLIYIASFFFFGFSFLEISKIGGTTWLVQKTMWLSPKTDEIVY